MTGTAGRGGSDEARDAGGPGIDALVAEILASPLGEVVARRDAAVRRLRAEGRRADADRVGRLRRPSPALWAVDRLHEVDPSALDDLLGAGGAVRAAQADLVHGRDGARDELTRAGRDLGAAVGRAARSALRLLAAGGHGAGAETERRVQSMLRAAALADDPARAALRAGRLTEEPQPEGFGAAGLEGMVAAAPPVAAPETPETRARRLELERAVVVRRGAAAEAERAAAACRARVASTRAELLAAETRVAEIRARLDAEDADMRAAQARAAEARDAHERATAALG